MKVFGFILTLFIFVSCGQDYQVRYNPDGSSSSEFSSVDSFTLDEEGKKVAITGREYTGLDHNNETKKCTQANMAAIMCTQEITAADEFGMRCLESSNLAVQCGCHDWICVQVIVTP